MDKQNIVVEQHLIGKDRFHYGSVTPPTTLFYLNIADCNWVAYTSSPALRSRMDARREKFITATKELVDTLNRVVEAGRKEFERVGGMQFSLIAPSAADAKGIRQIILPTWTGYWKWLNTVGVSTRNEMEQLWKSFGDDKDILKCVEQLHSAEKRYNELTAEADADVQNNEDKVAI